MIPDTDEERKRVLLVLQDKFCHAGTTMSDFEKERGLSRAYLTRVISGKRSSPGLCKAMADFLGLSSSEYPFGITEADFLPVQERLLERQLGQVVGEPYRDEVEVKSIPWKTMTPDVMTVLVWKHPSSVVGVMCGVSDVAIGKYCRKHGIRKPPRGYWAKQGRFTPNYSGK